jgi:hypothetical protein
MAKIGMDGVAVWAAALDVSFLPADTSPGAFSTLHDRPQAQPITCGMCQRNVTDDGWCDKCADYGIGALELAHKREGLAFWDRFPVEIRPQSDPAVDTLRAAMQPAIPANTIVDDMRTEAIGEFLIHLGASGVHLAEWAGGGVEPRVSSELAPGRLREVIAAYLSRS